MFLLKKIIELNCQIKANSKVEKVSEAGKKIAKIMNKKNFEGKENTIEFK